MQFLVLIRTYSWSRFSAYVHVRAEEMIWHYVDINCKTHKKGYVPINKNSKKAVESWTISFISNPICPSTPCLSLSSSLTLLNSVSSLLD